MKGAGGKMYKCKELNILEKYLEEHHIKHTDESDRYEGEYEIERIHYKLDGCDITYSCICGFGTYGVEKDLIEWWSGFGEPIGYLKAKDVIERIENEKNL